MNSMHKQLQEAFRTDWPELFLWKFSVPPGAVGGTASFRMLSSVYDIGLMRCFGTRVLCLTTIGVEYNRVDFYTGEEPPDFLESFAHELRPGELILVFSLDDDDEHAETCLLPRWEEQRLAYIVCEAVEYQRLTGRFEDG